MKHNSEPVTTCKHYSGTKEVVPYLLDKSTRTRFIFWSNSSRWNSAPFFVPFKKEEAPTACFLSIEKVQERLCRGAFETDGLGLTAAMCSAVTTLMFSVLFLLSNPSPAKQNTILHGSTVAGTDFTVWILDRIHNTTNWSTSPWPRSGNQLIIQRNSSWCVVPDINIRRNNW